MYKAVKILSHPTHMFPAEVKQGNALPSGFSSQIVNNILLAVCIITLFFFFFLHFCASSLVISLFKTTPLQDGHDVPNGENM